MHWSQRLNALSHQIALDGRSRAEILGWHYAAHLPDNAPHRHTFFEICLIGAYGKGKFRVQNRDLEIENGDCFFARPGMVHQIVNTQEPLMELSWLNFTLENGGDDMGTLIEAFSTSEICVVRAEKITAIWHALELASDGVAFGFELQASALIKALILAVLQSGCDLEDENFALHDARALSMKLALRYIADNLAKKLTPPEIAAHIHVSNRQLARLFAEYIGTSPAHYIERARIDRAQSLLLKSAKPLKEIAREVGYEDAAHFSRVFSKRNGNPPGDFRRRGASLIKHPSGSNIQKFGDLV